jgi:TfoX/Sxy family transcriptional regulator of competence genes
MGTYKGIMAVLGCNLEFAKKVCDEMDLDFSEATERQFKKEAKAAAERLKAAK